MHFKTIINENFTSVDMCESLYSNYEYNNVKLGSIVCIGRVMEGNM